MFGAPTFYGSDSSLGVVIADLNGDGKADLVAPESGAGGDSVDVYLGNGDGTFGPAANYICGTPTASADQPYAVAVADLTNNGHMDIVTANFGGTMSVLMGNGDGTFGAPTVYPAGSEPDGIAVGDFNGDGLPDIAVANRGDNTVGVYLNQGNGTFAPAVDYTVGGAPDSLGAADFGNGQLDLYTADTSGGEVSILLSNGDGTFAAASNVSVPGSPADAVAADFNRDGKLDIATVDLDTGSVSVLEGAGNGTFSAPITSPGLGVGAISLATADFNGDAIPDLVVVGFGTNSAAVLLGNGDGTFQAPISITPGLLGGDVTAGDLNGDGKPDVVFGSYGGPAQFSTLINGGGSAAAVKTIGGLDPTFATGGLASHDVGLVSTAGVAIQSNGQSVIAGTAGASPSELFGLTRYNADGSLDTTFGVGGFVSTSFNGTDDVAAAVKVLAGGQILVAGTATTFTGGVASGSEFAVAEYNADGSLDTSFGAGTGEALISFSNTPGVLSNDVLQAMTVSTDGVIYLGGSSDAGGKTGTDFAIAALTAAGALDTAFGSGGKVLQDFAGEDDVINSLALQSDGEIVAAGSATVAGITQIALARFLASGIPDKHFGAKGLVTTNVRGVYDSASSVIVQANGLIDIGGLSATGAAASISSDFLVAQYTSAGKINRSFGGGPVITSFGQPSAVTQLVIQTNGEIVASGKTAASLASLVPSNLDVAIARYTTGGVLDTSFDGTGKTIIDLSSGVVAATDSLAVFADLVIQPLQASSLGAEFAAFTSSAQGVVSLNAGGELLDVGNSGANTVEAELITAGVDLVTSLLTAPPAAVIDGMKGTASVQIAESGTDRAFGTVTIEIEVSTDAQGDGAATLKTMPERINLAQGRKQVYRIAFVYPQSISSGAYYLLADVLNGTTPALQDLNTENNLAASSTTVDVAPAFVALNGSALAADSAFTPDKVSGVMFDITNAGNVAAKGAITADVILSADQNAADGTTVDAGKLAVSLAAGKGRSYRLSFKVPSTVTPGSYYLIAVIDPADSLGSIDQTRSTVLDPTQLVVG